MYRRFHGKTGALILLPLLTGACVQMTRHSNMMIFGTNTVVGIRAGVNSTSVPELAVGYARQEAVVLPLLANVAESEGGQNRLVPCNPAISSEVGPGNGDRVIHPCSLVGVSGSVIDSYSVLASFGGNFDASATKDSPKARGGIAQYFATGVAAQNLALNGGAAVVASSEAAANAARNEPVSATSAFGNPEVYQKAIEAASRYKIFETKLIALIEASDDTNIKTRIPAFESNAQIQPPFLGTCDTVSNCLTAVSSGRYSDEYSMHPDVLEKSLKQWK